jgi:hypothetical protein
MTGFTPEGIVVIAIPIVVLVLGILFIGRDDP